MISFLGGCAASGAAASARRTRSRVRIFAVISDGFPGLRGSRAEAGDSTKPCPQLRAPAGVPYRTVATKRNPLASSLLALALGVLVFAAGLALARQWLPEWRTGSLPGKR